MSLVPFTRFRGHLKSIRLGDLNDLHKAALETICPEFFKEEKQNTAALQELGDFRVLGPLGKDGGNQDAFRYRRFAGDRTLPRSRYYSVCRDECGFDDATLRGELVAYSSFDHFRDATTTPFRTFDTEDPLSLIHYRAAHGEPTSGFQPRSVGFHLLADATPSPLSKAFASTGQTLQTLKDVIVQIPYHVEGVELDRVIDLRQFETQQWLVESVTNGIPGVIYLYSPQAYVRGLVLSGERPKVSDRDILGAGDIGGDMVIKYPPRVGWDRVARDAPPSFLAILPFLISEFRGGSPITDALGRWFRMLGADALIYPTARTNVDCIFAGKLMWRGWNLVDYRNAGETELGVRVIIDPDSWWGLRSKTDVRVLRGPEYGWLIRDASSI